MMVKAGFCPVLLSILKSTALFESSQALPACFSDESSMMKKKSAMLVE
jgi:hypothetical protein